MNVNEFKTFVTDENPDFHSWEKIELLYIMTNRAARNGWINALGEEEFKRLLAPYYRRFVRHEIERLENLEKWDAIDMSIRAIIAMGEYLGVAIPEFISLEELADIRRNAHLKVGCNAGRYLRTKEKTFRELSCLNVARAFLAGVSPFDMGLTTDEVKECVDNAFSVDVSGREKDYDSALAEATKLNELLNCRL